MIWVQQKERCAILRAIQSNDKARAELEAMQARVADALAQHTENRETFLRNLPLVHQTDQPGRHPTLLRNDRNIASVPKDQRRKILQGYALIAVDCGVLHFLTQEESYARCAADILNVFVEALVQMEPSADAFNGGWIYTGDHLYEARVVAAQLPIVYDFTGHYLRDGGLVHNLGSGELEPFNFEHAQQVFRTYADLAMNRGIVDCNWPVLEMASLAHNIMALDDPRERNLWLDRLIREDTEHQDSLTKVMKTFIEAGGVWPESFNYARAVAELTTYITALLIRSETPVDLPEGFAAIPLSMDRIMDFKFPNGEFIRFGDGSRYGSENFQSYQMAQLIARETGNESLQSAINGLIKGGLKNGLDLPGPGTSYHLSAHPYLDPLNLLWFHAGTGAGENSLDQPGQDPPVTDTLPFAGLVLQRNLSADLSPEDAMMAAIVGGHYVHGHASGMSLELFGKGHILGAPAGKGMYRSDEHENYRRLFAAYNCVIVNGSSASSGEWVNLGIDTVSPLAMEPRAGEQPVSPNHSFSVTGFADRQVSGTHAEQQRLVAIVRTSPSTGYYVDVFRSRSSGEDQFHDYLYHNIGDQLELSSKGLPLMLEKDSKRFQPAGGTQWVQNSQYLFPGWHFFSDVRSVVDHDGPVLGEFRACELGPQGVGMRLHIPGSGGRAYTQAMAPATREAPHPYDSRPTPVLVIRQSGPAWDQPFAVIYEPVGGDSGGDGIRSVDSLLDKSGHFAGFTVTSEAGGRQLKQLVLVQETVESELELEDHGIRFRGQYAVVTLDESGRCTALYIGNGRYLECGDRVARTGPESSATYWSEEER
jgi:hypothetical protein